MITTRKRLFSSTTYVYQGLETAVAYGEAIARGDMAWVQKTLRRSLKFILLSTGVVSLVLVILGNKILYLWVGPNINPSLVLKVGLGLWMIALTLGGTMSDFIHFIDIHLLYNI